MIIICEECGRQYRIDPDKIKGESARFKCKTCSHLIVAQKPDPKTTEPELIEPGPNDTVSPSVTSERVPKQEVEDQATPPIKEETKSAPQIKFRFGLTAKLFTVMLIVSLLPLILFWSISFKQVKGSIQNASKRQINQISIDIAKHIDEWFDQNVRALKTLANLDGILSMNSIKQEPFLKAIQEEYPWMYVIYSLDTSGMNVARSDGKSLQDYSDSQSFKNIIAGKTIAWETRLDKTSKKASLILAIPIKSDDKIVGVIAGAINIVDLSRRMTTWNNSDVGFAFLVDEKGIALAHPDETFVRQQKSFNHHPLIKAFHNGQRGVVSFTTKEGKSVLGCVRKTANGWILAIQQEGKEASYVIEQVLTFAYLLLGITVVFVFIIAWFLGRTLSRPILKLTGAADRISTGDLEVKIDTKRKDEIGDLAEAITRMQDSIRLSIERLRRKR